MDSIQIIAIAVAGAGILVAVIFGIWLLISNRIDEIKLERGEDPLDWEDETR